jgi:hypothetical protein
LLLHVLLKHRQWGAAACYDAVRAGPEDRLPVNSAQFPAEVSPGTAEKPGRNVKAKAGLNRAILDATPGSFLNRLSTKAQEAGCELIVLNTRRGSRADVPSLRDRSNG